MSATEKRKSIFVGYGIVFYRKKNEHEAHGKHLELLNLGQDATSKAYTLVADPQYTDVKPSMVEVCLN